MPKKVILDVDPGIDDAMAVCMALFDPRLEVIAVTAVGGNVAPALATRNVQAIIEQLDPPRLPRTGSASTPEDGLPVDSRHLYGVDGLGDTGLAVAELRAPHPSEKIICDEVRAAPDEVTIIALGPLTNIARAFQRDPELPSLVGRIVMVGGTVSGPGNITPAAEFNMYCDPQSARAVFRSHTTKTLVPLDATNRVVLTFDFLKQLPDEATRVGRLLRRIIPPAFRAFRQESGIEGIHAHDSVALLAATNPELFTTQEMAGDVEIRGDLTLGATVFDRRRIPAWHHNMEVAVDLDPARVTQQIIRNLEQAGKATG
jgi:inosine-uridine nucleoside N-ribohydrolase